MQLTLQNIEGVHGLDEKLQYCHQDVTLALHNLDGLLDGRLVCMYIKLSKVYIDFFFFLNSTNTWMINATP